MTVVEPPAYLVEHPPARPQFRHPRREEPSGVIAVHTAENTPDYVAFDGGAEAVAAFIRGRAEAGSYCDLVDSDSSVHLVRYMDEAFHDGTGTNPHSYGLSVATRADVWPLAPRGWRDGAIEQAAQAAARYAHWLHARRGILIPARRISAAQARARVPGFVTHAQLDPTRRSDPGAQFPWTQFLARYAYLMRDLLDPDPQPQEDDDMPKPMLVYLGPRTRAVCQVDGARSAVHWLQGADAVRGAKVQAQLDDPGNEDAGKVCRLDPGGTDDNLAALAVYVLGLPFFGPMPTGHAALRAKYGVQGPHYPDAAPAEA